MADGSPRTTKAEALTAYPARRVAEWCNARHWWKEVTAVATSLPDQVSRSRSRSRLAEGVPRPRSRMVAGQKLSEFARMTRFPCGEDNRKNVGCTLRGRGSAYGPGIGHGIFPQRRSKEHNIISLSTKRESWAEYKRSMPLQSETRGG